MATPQPRSGSESQKSRVSSDQRRSLLLDAAIRVFSKTGFCGTKTRDIAAEAHINEALLFRHFPTKDDLYIAILENMSVNDWIEAIQSAIHLAKDDVDLFIREYAKRTLERYRQHPELVRLLLYSALEQHSSAEMFRQKQIGPILNLITGYIAERQADGKFSRKVSADHAARILYGAVAHQGLVMILLGGAAKPMTDDEVADAITEIVNRGLLVRA
jgi:TetR/AcrR family transcriptional regulator